MSSKTIAIKHLAIIGDGNARWAKEKGLSISEGHQKGCEAYRTLLINALELNIPYLTIYVFSSENWQRPEKEIGFLINLLDYYLQHEIDYLIQNGVRLKIIGSLEKVNLDLQKRVNTAVKDTQHNYKMTLCIAFSYGSRLEIVEACQKILASGKKQVSEEEFKNYLYDPEMPEVDLLIRTGGALRISNFLLWQSAYAELLFSPKYWPEFDKNDLINAIEDYGARKRTFGARQEDFLLDENE